MLRLDRKRIIKQNICAHRSEVRKIRLAMTAACMLLILFLGTLLGAKRAFTKINDTFLNDRVLWIGCVTKDDVQDTVNELTLQEGVKGISIEGFAYLNPSGCALSMDDLLELETGDCFLKCEDVIFQGQSVPYKSSPTLPVWIQFTANHIVDQTSQNKELLQNGEAQFTPSEMLSTGRLPSGEHEIVLSGYILRAFGFEDDKQAALIGKPVSLGLLYDNEEHICIENYILTGIISDQYISHQSSVFSHIHIGYDSNNTELHFQSELGMDTGYSFSIHVSTDTFKRCHVLCKTLEASGHKDVGYPMTVQTAVYLNDAITITERLFSFVLIAFCIILLVSVVSGLYFYQTQVRESHNMLFTLGCTDRDLKSIEHTELLQIIGRAYGLSVIVTVGALLSLPMLLNKLTHGFKIFTLSYVDVLISLLAGAILCILCYLISTLCLKRLLHGVDDGSDEDE